ncbi:putative CAMK protein kinase [Rosellinia necatrix]|uniref:Putative CAMK protein kinase n=1 Tax=Rosellinia necatrix TaxID=77044 RepID=A0A1S8AAH4_ROSNE|nr:putative CAMK protein kinase [Rosellinia necatrix]
MQGWYHFLTETKVSSELSKACPGRFVEFFAWNAEPTAGSLYMAMEYVEFGDLEKTMEDTKLTRPWTEMDMKTVTRQILEGLQHMHGALIAHRDLKPKNILVASLDKEVSIKIADFGIAKRLSNRGTTNLRTPIGSSGYRAPEVVMSWEKNSRTGYSYNADIWSVGCIVYRMAHGEAMFRYDLQVMQDERRLRDEISGHLEALKEKKQQGDVSGIRISNSGVDFIEKLMTVDPKTRPCAKKALAALKGWSCIDQGGKRKYAKSTRQKSQMP